MPVRPTADAIAGAGMMSMPLDHVHPHRHRLDRFAVEALKATDRHLTEI
jgi:hypothetical protein